MLKFCKHVKFVSELHDMQKEADKEGASAIGISSQGNLYYYNKEKKSAEKINAEKAAELLGKNVSEIQDAVNNIDKITVSAIQDKATESEEKIAETKFTDSKAANLSVNELLEKITEYLNLLKAAIINKI